MVIIRDRIKRFQLALLTEYIDRRDTDDWKKISEDITLRREDVSDEIKKSLGRTGKRHAKEVDTLLDRSWDEIVTTLSGKQALAIGSSAASEQNTAQIKAMLEDILSKGTLTVQTITAPSTAPVAKKSGAAASAKKVSSVEEAEPVEEIAPVEEAESVEEIAPAEKTASAKRTDLHGPLAGRQKRRSCRRSPYA